MGLCDKTTFKYSAFNYGHAINNANRFINFSEGGLELTAILPIGSFVLGQVPDILASALNQVGGQEYTVTLDRTNNARALTISAPGNFELLIASGSNAPTSFYGLAGFSGADLVGANSYTGGASGSQYVTQTELKNFINFNENKEKIDSVIRTTPNGLVESISYGTLEKASFDLPFITNKVPQRFIRETATGKEELEDFMDYCINKNPVEFIELTSSPELVTPCLLDKVSGYSKGDGYKLRSLVTKKLKDYYELRGLVFRKIEV